MSQPFKLYRLQQTDSLLDHARSRLEQIEKILRDDAQLQQAENRTAETEAKLNEIKHALKRSEEEVLAQRIKIEQTESTLYGGKVRNPKELQDLQNEAAALKRYLAVLEDRQLENMMALEDVEAEHNLSSQALNEVRSMVATQHALLNAEKNNLLRDVERLENERTTITSTIEGGDIDLYTNLRRQKMGVAVSKVVDRACSACGSTLTPSAIQGAQAPTQIIRCTFCGRILYAG